MLRVVVIALFTAFTVSSCATPDGRTDNASDSTGKRTVISSHVTVEGAARMMAAKGAIDKWHTAERICNEAGHETGTTPFVHCFTDYQSFALRATRARAKALTDDVARRHGLCIDRVKFEISRCREI